MSIILHGMMTSENFGDLILCEKVAKIIDSSSNESLFLARASESVETALGKPRANAKAWMAAKGVILSGGGFFQRLPPGILGQKQIIKYAYPFLFAHIRGIPTATVGLGVSNPSAGLQSLFLKMALSGSRPLNLRDEAGYQALLKLGVGHAKLTTDLVFCYESADLNPEDVSWAREILKVSAGRRLVGINVSGGPGDGGFYKSQLDCIAEIASVNDDAFFVLIEDHQSVVSAQSRAAGYLYSRLGDAKSLNLPYPGHRRLLALLSAIDVVFSNKLHVCLTAANFGASPYSIAKHPKNIASFKQLGISSQCVEMRDCSDGDMKRLIGDALNSPVHFECPAEVRSSAKMNETDLAKFAMSLSNPTSTT